MSKESEELDLKKIIKQTMDDAAKTPIEKATAMMRIKNQLSGMVASYDLEGVIYALIDHVAAEVAKGKANSKTEAINKKLRKLKEDMEGGGMGIDIVTGPASSDTSGVLGKDNYIIPIKLGKIQRRASLEQSRKNLGGSI